MFAAVSASRANAEVKFLLLLEFLSRIPQEGLNSEFLEIMILVILISSLTNAKKKSLVSINTAI